ncbi:MULTISPECIES: acyl carrier protein [unclassified Streptomyces]|uniref:acyl carrier protein n=1 Tax=unclassified Streptomyces TaxID=2593676 RepID=UPI0025B4B5F1|nr:MULTISPECIES: acyl carrier protein [unclassified Streptomyces]MDN3247623.1 acyl carrier protein [Streptomyces sp. ZSW22]MDN3254047.1 acyl carrier protein [Streptomyces sp. MA25(2023)]
MTLTYDDVVSILAEITGMDEEEFTPQTALLDVKIDSLDLAVFDTILAERHGVDLVGSLGLTPATTIADFTHILSEQSASAEAAPSVTGTP